MDVDMIEASQAEIEESVRKKRVQVYRSILNYYRGRSLSLDVILSSTQPSITISPEMRTHEELAKHIKGLHDDISLIKSLQNCVKLISSSLASTEIMGLNDSYLRRDNINKIEKIIYFSKSIMKLYSDCLRELDLIEKKKKYCAVLAEYSKNLDSLKENKKDVDGEDAKSLEKAELQVYKINLIRAIKSILIGFISENHPSLLERVHSFRSPVRRNLTIDDMNDAWDVGLPS